MDFLTFFEGSKFDSNTERNLFWRKEKINSFYKEVYDTGNNITLSEFFDLQKKGESKNVLIPYVEEKGYKLDDDTAKAVNDQINTQAALQTIQNFYDMYISPTGNTDVIYRLGEVTGRAAAGTVNSQTDKNGLLLTRSIYNAKIKYYTWTGKRVEPREEYYSVLWFPPFKPSSIKTSSIKKTNSSAAGSMTMSEYLAEKKRERQQELDEKNAKLLAQGKEDQIESTEAEDTRLVRDFKVNDYYDTFDLTTLKAARSSFTYRTPAFKAINDNINFLQWLLEGVSGIVSTYLTEWDVSLYMQEGLVSDNAGQTPNVVYLTYRMEEDNPNGYKDDRATSWGVINCAISKVKKDNEKTWDINSYPQSTFHTMYPDPYSQSGWLNQVKDEEDNPVLVPVWYDYGKEGFTDYLAGKDRGGRRRQDNLQTRLMYQDFENAALSGYTDWSFNKQIWKALYTTDDDGFSDVDTIFLSTAAGLYKKSDLISQVEEAIYGTSSQGEAYDNVAIIAGNDASGDSQTTGADSLYSDIAGDGNDDSSGSGYKKGGRLFLSLFKKKSKKKKEALKKAESMQSSSPTSAYGTAQDSLGLVKKSKDPNALSGNMDSDSDYLLGMSEGVVDNSNGVGVPQNNPTLYGGPHGYYRSPRSYQSYFQENNGFLRNVPRVDKMPEDMSHDSWAGINYPSIPNSFDDYYYKGNEKWCSNVSAAAGGEHQAYEQSWSAGMSRLCEGIHTWSWAYAYVKTAQTVEVRGEFDYKGRVVFPSYDNSGEKYNYTGSWWIDRTRTYYRNMSYRQFKRLNVNRWSSKHWAGSNSYVSTAYPKRKAIHYVWKKTMYKRYLLHSEKDLNWTIARVQHYYSYVSSGSRDDLMSAWQKTFSKIFGYNKDFLTMYTTGSTEDYELFIPGGGVYSQVSFYDEKNKQYITDYMTGNEHKVMSYMVDWNRGVGSHNKLMFMTRGAGDLPDCLFRCEVYHSMKPLSYWVQKSKKYSSNKRKYWFEPRTGWKHYMSVRLHTTDRFFAGLNKTAFTSLGSQSSSYLDVIEASTVPKDGALSAAIRSNSFYRSSSVPSSCAETRKSPYDLMKTSTRGRAIPRYNPETQADEMTSSYTGITGKGIFGDIPGLTFIADDKTPAPKKPEHTITAWATNFNQTKTRASFLLVDSSMYIVKERGHTLFTVDLNRSVTKVGTFDTYGKNSECDRLAQQLQSLKGSKKIVVLISWDATRVNSSLCNALEDLLPIHNVSHWSAQRMSHIVIGRENDFCYNDYSKNSLSSGAFKFNSEGFISGKENKKDESEPEIFSDKMCCIMPNKLDVQFKDLQFPLWRISYFGAPEASYNGNTYRLPGGYPVYSKTDTPWWWTPMILNMSLRNTFYRGDTSGPQKKTFSLLKFGIDVTGLTQPAGAAAIESRDVTIVYEGQNIKIRADNVQSYTVKDKVTYKNNDEGVPVPHTSQIVNEVTLKNVWISSKYFFTSFDLAPRFMYSLVSMQMGFLESAKEYLCGHVRNSRGEDDYTLSFDFIKKIMEGTPTSAPLISPRAYLLADPDNTVIHDDDGNEMKCEDVYGYNMFLTEARALFCNDPKTNRENHHKIEQEFDKRISVLSQMRNVLSPYVNLSMREYSYNIMFTAWKTMDSFLDLKYDETIETFMLAYLNVLYEARRYFINKRCNKQDGTLWACRHLEKLVPLAVTSAVASSARVNMAELSKASGKEKVEFYEVQNTLADKADVIREHAKDKASTVSLEDDKIITVYVKVKYATKADYDKYQKKLRNGEITKNDECVIKVHPWSFIKRSDGTFKKKSDGEALSYGEEWNENGYAIRRGKVKYAVKPMNGVYDLLSKEIKLDEQHKIKKLANPEANVTVYSYDTASWHIDWNKLVDKIVYNLYGGVDLSKIRDLTAYGVKDPMTILCGAKESSDYWRIPVETAKPKAEGYKSQITLEMRGTSSNGENELLSKDNETALAGVSAYAMWPVIEEQGDVIPNAGDFTDSIRSLI